MFSSREEKNKWHRRYNKEHPEQVKAIALKYKYRLTVGEYYRMLEDQGGVCAICKKPPGKKMLAVDHSHKTKAVRGLLCVKCNSWLGRIDDDPTAADRAADYLRKSEVPQPK